MPGVRGFLCRPEFRSGCDFVPYTESKLKEIADVDLEEGRHWTPPPVSTTLPEMCERLKSTDAVEQPVARVLVPPELPPITESPLVEAGQASTEEPSNV